jgi:class 3 adenylate cyclase
VYLAASTIVALSAVDAGDLVVARSVALTARWRHGLRGPVSLDNLAIPIALVEVGDLLGDPELVALGRAPLEEVHEAGVVIPLAWPVTIPRLLGTAARHAGDLGRARAHLDHALAVAERQRLRPEQARVLFELAQVGAAAGEPIHDVEALLYAAVRLFDELSMHGWAARCEATARMLGASTPVGGPEVVRQRAILTTDIVGSTSTNARLGDLVYVEQLHVHDRLLRQRVREFGGTEIKHTGDGLNVIFDRPEAALRCAAASQADVVAWREAEPDLALSIRCGVAWGRLVPVGADFFGLVQAEAARLCALAERDEVLTSAPAAEAVASTDLRVEGRGAHSLKGFPEPVEVFALTSD